MRNILLAVLIGTTILLPAACTEDASEMSREYELLTILGDVQDRPDDAPGRWRPVRDGAPPAPLTEEELEKMSEVITLPYVQGSRKAPEISNVTRHDTLRAFDGVNVYTSGHTPAAFIVDMAGNVLHEWSLEVTDVWPKVPETIHSTFFRRVHAYPNGDLLAIFEGIGLVKLDRSSRVLWSFRGGCHHQAFVTDDGTIYVLTRRAQMVERINADKPIVPDGIAILNNDGTLEREIPLLDCFENSRYKQLLSLIQPRGDIFHTNSIYVFDGTGASFSPHMKRGNVLISLLTIDTIAIVDMESEQVVWAAWGRKDGLWKKQHDPRFLPNNNILLFDNRGYHDKSRVIEYDTQKQGIVWQYAGTPGDELYSRTCGTCQPLPNGNILITESDNGRALEITRAGDTVWEFYNPHRAGEDDELIATLFALERVATRYFPWLKTNR